MEKPGIKTTEFWATLAVVLTSIVTLFVSLGKVTPGDATMLQQAITQGITSLGAFVAAATVVWKYIASRTLIKTKGAA